LILAALVGFCFRRPRAATAALPAPDRSGLVVDNGLVRVLDSRLAAEVFTLAVAQVAPAAPYEARGQVGLDPTDSAAVRAPRPCRIAAVAIKPGDEVRKGDHLLRLECGSAAASSMDWLLAPRSGRVMTLEAPPGVLVSPLDETPLVRLSSSGRLLVTTTMPKAIAARLFPGDRVQIVPVLVNGARPIEGSISGQISPAGDQSKVQISVEDPGHDMRTGTTVDLHFVLPAGAPGLVSVPQSAVVSRRGRYFVLVERAGNRIEPVAVQVTREHDGGAEIAGPLAAGDRYVSDGAIYLLNMLALEGVL
jgi:multidrug efflux pump subunit AcrA (membrane-fusion protein)